MSGWAPGEQTGRVRIGVTGHRDLADTAAATQAVDRVLEGLVAGRGALVVSALAEGADRLVARRGLLRSGVGLHAVLPLPVADYETDFATDASRAEFHDLLARAERTDVVGNSGDDRVAAYRAAGLAMLDASDVVVALWDGEPGRGAGGTADIVAEARRRGRDVRVVPVQRGAA
jgi:hypothetical protein